jgi:hypothetical protein
VLESAGEGEITDHLGYERHDPAGRDGGNSRNGLHTKTELTDIGPVQVPPCRSSGDGIIITSPLTWLTTSRFVSRARPGGDVAGDMPCEPAGNLVSVIEGLVRETHPLIPPSRAPTAGHR